MEISGLYLANPPNEKEARVIDEFVDQLQKSEVFKIEEKDKAKAVIQRTTPDGQLGLWLHNLAPLAKALITLP